MKLYLRLLQAIVPMFTKNCREAIRAMSTGRRKSFPILHSLIDTIHHRIFTIYLRTNSITISAYLRNLSSKNDVRHNHEWLINDVKFIFSSSTYLGQPIPYDPDVTPDELALRVNKHFFLLERTLICCR